MTCLSVCVFVACPLRLNIRCWPHKHPNTQIHKYTFNMKLNWGTGIAIFYTAFVIVMVGMVVYSKNFDHSLVVDNYYEEDLKYQDHIDAVKNAQALAQDLIIRETPAAKSVLFEFPNGFQTLGGNILFYRADDKSKDFEMEIVTDAQGKLEVPSSQLQRGRWTVKVNWLGDGKPFYKEEIIVL
jgi:nitrogen fixation protein FixH